MRKLGYVLGILLVFGGSVVVVGGWVACQRGTHPVQAVSPYNPSQFDLPLEDVRFESRDGVRLAGWYVPGSSGATVVLAHGRGGSRSDMLPHANYLHRAGFSVLLFDFRYRGDSEGSVHTVGAKEPWNLQAAVGYLLTRSDVDHERIGVQGGSLGAVSSILAAAETPAIRGVVAEIPYADLPSAIAHSFDHPQEGVGLPSFPFAWATKLICELCLGVDFDSVSPLKVIGRISPRPVFLIDNLGDDMFSGDSVERLYAAAGEPKSLWSLAAPHGRGWETTPDEYERRVLAFWRQTFGLDSPE
jgi:fermentation-respiration switch protein FrsA (DUF1100 family)